MPPPSLGAPQKAPHRLRPQHVVVSPRALCLPIPRQEPRAPPANPLPRRGRASPGGLSSPVRMAASGTAPAKAQMETLTDSLISAFFPDALASPAPFPLGASPLPGRLSTVGSRLSRTPLPPQSSHGQYPRNRQSLMSQRAQTPQSFCQHGTAFSEARQFSTQNGVSQSFCPPGVAPGSPASPWPPPRRTHLPGHPSAGQPRLSAPFQPASRGGKRQERRIQERAAVRGADSRLPATQGRRLRGPAP